MVDLKQLQLQYVINEAGEKTAIILPIREFHELIEDLEDLAAVAERCDEPTLSHDEVIAELKRDGILHRYTCAFPKANSMTTTGGGIVGGLW